jgi:hypothetical protein
VGTGELMNMPSQRNTIALIRPRGRFKNATGILKRPRGRFKNATGILKRPRGFVKNVEAHEV